VAQTRKGQVQLRKVFTVTGQHWALISFWVNRTTQKRFFTFAIEDRPMTFQ
jgi:hypothetical protein